LRGIGHKLFFFPSSFFDRIPTGKTFRELPKSPKVSLPIPFD